MLRYASFEDTLKFHVNDTLKILSEKFRNFNPKEISTNYLLKTLKQYSFGEYPMVLYVACKLLQPKVVVETGAGAGLASTFILKALSENGEGALYSIDLPKMFIEPNRVKLLMNDVGFRGEENQVGLFLKI